MLSAEVRGSPRKNRNRYRWVGLLVRPAMRVAVIPQPTMRNPIQYGRPTRSATSCDGICTSSLIKSTKCHDWKQGGWPDLDQLGCSEVAHSRPSYMAHHIGKSSSICYAPSLGTCDLHNPCRAQEGILQKAPSMAPT